MMLGSLLYTGITSHPPPTTPERSGDSSLTVHAKLSGLVCAISALSFAVSVRFPSEHVRFAAFCVFEACVGMYYPVQGMLRGTLIPNEHRATVSIISLFSVIPLSLIFLAFVNISSSA
jgi:MFS transporter, MFS domain-containing protein family, molybdate-anion transporter